MQLAKEMTTRFPNDHWYLRILGDAYLRTHVYGLAAESYGKAVYLSPINSKAVSVLDLIHENYCDNCNSNPIKGTRHLCVDCGNYDLCERCVSITPHPHPGHKFLMIPSGGVVPQPRENRLPWILALTVTGIGVAMVLRYYNH